MKKKQNKTKQRQKRNNEKQTFRVYDRVTTFTVLTSC